MCVKMKLIIIELVIYISFIQIILCLPGGCKPGFIQRKNKQLKAICCQPVICAVGQMYDFCTDDGGKDVCMSCPEGTYHKDVIDTAKMPIVIDPCVAKPSCEQPEVILVGDACVCDLSKGYFGTDPHNCYMSEIQCNSPGYELTHNGKCEQCKDGYYKSESGQQICKAKRSCSSNQVVVNNGSATEDRRCEEVSTFLMSLSNYRSNTNSGSTINSHDLQTLLSNYEDLKKEVKELKEIQLTNLKLRLDSCDERLARLEKRGKRKRKSNKRSKKGRKIRNGKRTTGSKTKPRNRTKN